MNNSNGETTDTEEVLLLDLKDAAKVLSMSQRKVWQLAKDGVLPSLKIGCNRRFSVAALRDWIKSLSTSS
jgi:excisionase family DNA binding protein